jgi:hypothetical protein
VSQLTETDLSLLSLHMLLFADAIALFTSNPNSLQSFLDNIYIYSLQWALKSMLARLKYVFLRKEKRNAIIIGMLMVLS